MIVINFQKNALLLNLCPADHPGQQVSLEAVCLTHILRKAIIWRFMTLKTFFFDTEKV